ncbi:MAG: hypothetical protein LBT27_05450 [Prevotellaceae bacterium]|jgi:hypothetical protein|nr:hypothetical protein [Prevotellaceae bacterium]
MKNIIIYILILSDTTLMAQNLYNIDVCLDKDNEKSVFLTEVCKTEPKNYYSEIEDFDKIEFSMTYKLRMEYNTGLYQSIVHGNAYFLREDDGRYKIMEYLERESVNYDARMSSKFKVKLPDYLFVGYSDDTTLLAVKILNYLTENQLIGKTYQAKISESCAKTLDGGYTTYTYCILKFEKNNVRISYKTKTSRTYEEKDKGKEEIRKWTVQNNRIIIQDFDDYGTFKIQDAMLVGEKMQNNNRLQQMVFNENVIETK